MGIDIEGKFLAGLQKRERELAQRQAAATDRRGAESETPGISKSSQIPPEMRIRKAIGRMFPNPGRGWPEE